MNCDTMSLKNPTNQFEWQVKDFHETKREIFCGKCNQCRYQEKHILGPRFFRSPNAKSI